MRSTSSIIEEKPERFSLSHDRIYLIGSVGCKWRYQPKLIHSLLGDSYGWLIMLAGRLTHLAELNINPICPAFPEALRLYVGVDVEKGGDR